MYLVVVKATSIGSACHQLAAYMNGSAPITLYVVSGHNTHVWLMTIWWYLSFGKWGDYHFYLLYQIGPLRSRMLGLVCLVWIDRNHNTHHQCIPAQ